MKLLQKASLLPELPGCYIMKNSDEKTLYIGKAKNLKKRVTSYFNSSSKTYKTNILVSSIVDFEFIITNTEAEALVLENNLIKKYRPKYNICLKDDRTYPYIVVDNLSKFPRLEYSRNITKFRKKRNLEVFGPFVSGSNIVGVLRVLNKSFKLRSCGDVEFNRRKTPCLLYQMNQCSAPCVNKISEVEYKKLTDCALDILKGKRKRALEKLENEMFSYADNEEFEKAALARDQIKTLNEFLDFSKQKIAEKFRGILDSDFISYYYENNNLDISIYIMRNGILLGQKKFDFELDSNLSNILDYNIVDLIYQYYFSENVSIPKQIVTSFTDEINILLSDSINIMLNKLEINNKVSVCGSKKNYKEMIKLATKSARENQIFRIRNNEGQLEAALELKSLLKIEIVPRKIECFDIAIWQGKSPTASQVVFIDGRPDKKLYRHYHMEERPEGNNDFAMMEELISRRVKYDCFPDIFLVDGGKGQVSSFQKILKEKRIDIPVVGIAKSKVVSKHSQFRKTHVSKSSERLIIPGRLNDYILTNKNGLLKLIVALRDEAHRFSRRLHHNKESKRVFTSIFDRVSGVGPKTRDKILRRLDVSNYELSSMSISEISKYLDVSNKIAEGIKKEIEKELEINAYKK